MLKNGKVFLALFRGFSFFLACVQIVLAGGTANISFEKWALVILVGVYTITKILVPFRWYQKDVLTYLVLASDLIVCAAIPVFTGGLSSAFLIYSLNVVLTIALVANRPIALSTATVLSLTVILTQTLYSRFHLSTPSLELPSQYIGYLLIYSIVCYLAAILPFIFNENSFYRVKTQAITEERNRLAREMHDNLAQSVGYLRLKTKQLKDALQAGNDGYLGDELGEMQLVIDEMYTDIREALGVLRIKTLDNVGFAETLREYVHEFGQKYGIKVTINIIESQVMLSTLAELQVLRGVQEALANVRKHAHATSVEVRFETIDNRIEIHVIDNGCGFNRKICLSQNGSEHMGLNVMRERIESIGGTMMINGQLGEGTELIFNIPLSKEATRNGKTHRIAIGR